MDNFDNLIRQSTEYKSAREDKYRHDSKEKSRNYNGGCSKLNRGPFFFFMD